MSSQGPAKSPRRWGRWLWLWRLFALVSVCFTGWMGAWGLAQAQAQQVADLSLQQVSPSVWFVEGLSAMGSAANRNFISNAGVVVTPAGVVVVDGLGSPGLAASLVSQIRKITPLPVTHVIVTHYHADHVYGLQVFKDLGATILAHGAAQPYLHSDTARLRLQASRQALAPWVNDDTRLVAADQWLTTKTVLTLGGVDIVVQPVGPSHTPEDLVVYVPSERVLFSGDVVFRGRIPFVGQADSGLWVQALDVLMGFHASVLVPGHGPSSRDPLHDMELTRDYLVYLRATMGKAAADMEPFEAAYAATDWGRFEALPLFRFANRMNAYNTYLSMEHTSP